MIGPIYNDLNSTPVGIVQLVNKYDKRPISENDVRKFKIIQELLGRSVYNTSEIHKLINVTIGFSSKLGKINELAMNSVFESEITQKTKRNKF